jgi:predicted transglutaminase-like cysteine proteinase
MLATPAFAASPPAAFWPFCATHPGQCARNGSGGPVAMTGERWRELRAVNAEVNRAIRPIVEKIDRWSVLPNGGKGDCEDYALTKRMKLMRLGWPSSALLITVVRLPNGDGHAVLTVRTSEGLYVLDNLRGSIRRPQATGYRYFMRQSPGNPRVWEVVASNGAS